MADACQPPSIWWWRLKTRLSGFYNPPMWTCKHGDNYVLKDWNHGPGSPSWHWVYRPNPWRQEQP